jgi:peroxiredoxin
MQKWRIIALYILILCVPNIADLWAIDIGSRLDNFHLSDVSGTEQSLQSYSGKIVAMVFWSFKCPTSLFYADRIQKLKDKYGHRGVVLLGVNSAPNERAPEIRANIANLNLAIPFLLDAEGSLAEKLGATHTPSVFIFDGSQYLRYEGALDNNRKVGESGRIALVEEAIESLLQGRHIQVSTTETFGCNIPIRGVSR